ncbi:MAG: phosphate signaling complex protein PhoU [Planctomycetota bacterium]|jgi:phosphate transport system protein
MPIDLATELIELRRSVLSMAASVEERVNQAVEALLNDDPELARLIRAGDDEIDRMEIDNEEECLRILALTQPVASDLRFVLAAMRINGQLERSADLARSIAKRVIDLDRVARRLTLPDALVTMARETQRMFSGAISALVEEEPAQARKIRVADQRVDDLQKEVFAWAQELIPRDVSMTAAAIDVLSVARKFERIADLSTNIAEEVIFLVEGTLVRHVQP